MKCDAEVTLSCDSWKPEVGASFATTMEMPEMAVRVEFEEIEDGRTRLTVTHSGMPSDDICGIIKGGWTNSLAMLDELIAVQT